MKRTVSDEAPKRKKQKALRNIYAKALIDQLHQIVEHAKAGEMNDRLQKQEKAWKIEMAEDGNRIATIQVNVKYYFGDLTVPEKDRNYQPIGSTINSLKSALKKNGKYQNQTTAWWKEHTKDVLEKDVDKKKRYPDYVITPENIAECLATEEEERYAMIGSICSHILSGVLIPQVIAIEKRDRRCRRGRTGRGGIGSGNHL